MNKYILFSIVMLFSIQSFAQNKKPKSRTETVIDIDKKSKKEVSHKESIVKFNSNGDVIEEINYDKKGVENKHVKYEYNAAQKKIKEVHYNAKGAIKKIVVIKYDENGLKSEEIEYAADGKTIEKRTKYIYEF